MSYYILDYIPGEEPLAQAVSEDFKLFNLYPEKDIKIGDLIDEEDKIGRKEEIDFQELSQGSKTELEYGIKKIVEHDEDNFISFFNEAGAISIRMHQLDLLPGVGEKTRNSILDKREKEDFKNFEDLEERVKEIHNPEETVIDRIIQEIKDQDIKYRLFVR